MKLKNITLRNKSITLRNITLWGWALLGYNAYIITIPINGNIYCSTQMVNII